MQITKYIEKIFFYHHDVIYIILKMILYNVKIFCFLGSAKAADRHMRMEDKV